MSIFELDPYLARIGFSYCVAEPPEETLKRLHRCHAFAIAYESRRICVKPGDLRKRQPTGQLC